MAQPVISGSGLWKPEFSISNQELVEAHNAYADKYNSDHEAQIQQGELEALPYSSAEFIEKASGITHRYVYQKEGILDINRMRPKMEARPDDACSQQAEMAVAAAKAALAAANKQASDIDAVIVSCSYTQRAYPAMAIEVQNQLGINGFAYDMLVACSSATFALHRAYEMVKAETAGAVLVISPELASPQINFGDRDSHFIFGDAAAAVVVESEQTCTSTHSFKILSTKAFTQFSNNIRSNFSYVDRATDSDPFAVDRLFSQNGRKVFKEVCPLAAEHIETHLASLDLQANQLRRLWLHQANINMNGLIAKRLLGRDPTADEAPIVLDRYANTGSAGSVICFNLNHQDMASGDLGVLCSFGAGYSIGSLILQKR